MNKKYYDVYLTDFGFHHFKPSESSSLTRTIEKCVKSDKPKRAYFDKPPIIKNGKIILDLEIEQDIMRFRKDARNKNKVLRIFPPNSNVPIYIDTVIKEKFERQSLDIKNKT